MFLHLDFIQPRRRPALAGWLLAGVALTAIVSAAAWLRLDLVPAVDAAQARLRRESQALAAAEPPSLQLAAGDLGSERARAGRLVERLAVGWAPLFSMLESTAGQPVAVLSLEPDAEKHELVLTGEARNFDALVTYYQFLQRQPMLRDVALQTHQVNRQDRDKPVRFRIVAGWTGAT